MSITSKEQHFLPALVTKMTTEQQQYVIIARGNFLITNGSSGVLYPAIGSDDTTRQPLEANWTMASNASIFFGANNGGLPLSI
jgi:hypothetical protein